MNRFTFALRLLDAAVTVRHSTGLIPVGTWRDRLASWRAEAEGSLGQGDRPTREGEASSSQILAEAIDFVQGVGGASGKRAAGKSALSRRETEVVALIAVGKSDQEIADALFISRRTASNHVAAIMQKLEAPSRAGAAVIAVRDGLI